MKQYLTVKQTHSVQKVIKRSRFIATIANVEDASSAIEFINAVKAQYSDATHNCYAYIIEDTERKCSDDGEPQGTAGIPILEVLMKNELKRIVVVVTRYFGGVKLGSAGLIGAYSLSAVSAVSGAKKVKMIYSDYLIMECDYNIKKRLDSVIRKNNGFVLNTEYLQNIITEFVVPEEDTISLIEDIADLTSGKGQVKKIKSGYFPYSIKRGEL